MKYMEEAIVEESGKKLDGRRIHWSRENVKEKLINKSSNVKKGNTQTDEQSTCKRREEKLSRRNLLDSFVT